MDCSFQLEGSLCGVSRLGTGTLPLLACKRDMTSHLVSLGISGKRGRGKTRITESELILNRAGLFGTVNEEEIQAMTICPKHRKELTTDWPGRKGQLCCSPSHKKSEALKPRLAYAAGAYPGFRSMKRLGVFLLPLDGMLVHRRSLPRNFVRFPQQFAGTHLYSWVERGTVRVKCLAQEHNTVSPARARTRTARSGDERTNHEATAPLIKDRKGN